MRNPSWISNGFKMPLSFKAINDHLAVSKTPLTTVFSARFSIELRIQKQKKSKKDQRNFFSNTIFNV